MLAGDVGDVESPTPLASGGPNAIAVGLGVLGDEWSLLILRAVQLGSSRYGEFQEQLGISAASLASRLAALTAEGLLTRRIYQDRPVRAEYVLTRRGRAVWPILLGIWDWERTWVPGQAQALPTMSHALCGKEFRPQLACGTCDGLVGPMTTHSTWGDAGGWPRSIPETTTRRRSASAGGPPEQFAETMSIFGNRWSAVIVGAAFQGMRRYSEFQSALSVPSNSLAERLRMLVSKEFLAHEATVGPRSEYRLTEKGLAFFPIVVLALQWSERWYVSPEGAALDWAHDDHPLVARLDCGTCGRPLRASDVVIGGRGTP